MLYFSHLSGKLAGNSVMLLRCTALVFALGCPIFGAGVVVGLGQAPPLAFWDAEQKPAGFAVDVLNEAARRERIELVWKPVVSAERVEQGLDDGAYDLLAAGVDTPRRRTRFYVSEPWWSWEVAMLKLHEAPVTRGARIALPTPVFLDLVERYFPGAAASVPNVPRIGARAAAEEVCTGRAEAALMTDNDLHQLLLDRPERCRNIPLQPLDTSVVMELAIVARRPAEDAARRLRARIDEMALDGTLTRLAGRHPVPALGAIRLADRLRSRYDRRTILVIGSASAALLSMAAFFLMRQSRSKRELWQARERYRAFFEQPAMGTAEVDPVTLRFLNVNDLLCRMLGYPREELLTKSFAEITHPDDRPANVELYEKFVRHEIETYTLEKRYLRKNGEAIWTRVHAAPVHDNRTGALLYTIGFIQDISERKEMERQLEESEQRFRYALTNAPFPAVVHAEDGEILQSSRAWWEITGYSPEEVRTVADWTERAYPGEREQIAAHVKGLFERDWSERIDEGEYTVRTASGEERTWFFGSARIGRDSRGRRLVLTMAADISDLKEAQKQIRVLEGLLPICAGCKKIRDEGGDWQQIESYITERSHAQFSHGLCPACAESYFPHLGVA
jgi:PAS domain S-box-containing protein